VDERKPLLAGAYLAAAECAADPADREALRAAAADATFRRPRLDEPAAAAATGAVLSPAGAYAAAVAVTTLST
jgi:hypothetical protein